MAKKNKKNRQHQAKTTQVAGTSAAAVAQEAAKETAVKQSAKVAAGAGDGKVLIKSTFDSVHTIGIPSKSSAEGGVHNSLKLMPGVNSVPAVMWEAAKKHKVVQVHIEEGLLTEFGKRGLADLGERGALRLVKETVDKALLEQWLEADERTTVVDALEKQLAAIAPSKPPKKDEDEGDDEDTDDGDDAGDDDE